MLTAEPETTERPLSGNCEPSPINPLRRPRQHGSGHGRLTFRRRGAPLGKRYPSSQASAPYKKGLPQSSRSQTRKIPDFIGRWYSRGWGAGLPRSLMYSPPAHSPTHPLTHPHQRTHEPRKPLDIPPTCPFAHPPARPPASRRPFPLLAHPSSPPTTRQLARPPARPPTHLPPHPSSTPPPSPTASALSASAPTPPPLTHPTPSPSHRDHHHHQPKLPPSPHTAAAL